MFPQRDGNMPATTRQRPGKDNLAPAEDVHNKNPSLVALGKNAQATYVFAFWLRLVNSSVLLSLH